MGIVLEAVLVSSDVRIVVGALVVGCNPLLFIVTQVPESRGISLEKLETGVVTGSIYTVSPRKRR